MTIQRDRNYIANVYGPARGIDPGSIHSHVSGARKARGGRPGTYHPRMPQPLIDALTIQFLAIQFTRQARLSAAPWRWFQAAP